jgi:hypothetical protein
MFGHQLKTTGSRTSSTRFFALLLLSIWLFCGAGCKTAPVQEMSEARQAIDAARAAGAERYANTELERALSSLKTAEQMLNDRRFRDARRSARQARDEAIKARQAAQEASDE